MGLKPNMGLKKLKKKKSGPLSWWHKAKGKKPKLMEKHSKNHGFFDQKLWVLSPTSPTETIQPAAVSHNMGP